MRSIPEKTLEHWTSIYLSNTFPGSALWWPTSGEDVLLELPRLAETGAGTTLALELKTTEASDTDDRHVLNIDTNQLDRYLNPDSGPPLPVYYVFPLPHWSGALTSTSGSSPGPPNGSVPTPSEWWRRRAGQSWFGNWLYVMSARSVSDALPSDWRDNKKPYSKLLTVDPNQSDSWTELFTRLPLAGPPSPWKSFWPEVTSGGPSDGIRWRTNVDELSRRNRLVVLDRDERQVWDLADAAGQHTQDYLRPVDTHGVTERDAEHVVLHIPESALSEKRPF